MARHRRKDYSPEDGLDAHTLQAVHTALEAHMEAEPEEGTASMLKVVETMLEEARK